MAKRWDTALSDGVVTMRELAHLLTGFGQPVANVGPDPDLPIYEGVTYLMPLLDTIKALGIVKKVNSKILVACPGFPFETLFAYSFNGVFENGFDTAWIVTDQANQTVAVQFTHVSTRHARVDTPWEKKEWVTFDFVNTRIKGQPAAKVAHGTKYIEPGVLRIDSVFINPTATQEGNELHPSRLYLPKPLADLIMYRIKKSVTIVEYR